MSYNYNNEQVVLTANQARSIAEQRTNELLSKHIKTTTWFDPVRKMWFKANNPTIDDEPQYDQYVASAKQMGVGRNALRAGSIKGNNLSSTEIDNALYKGISNEFLDEAVRLNSDIDKLKQNPDLALKGGGFITAESYPTLANVMVDTQILELVARDFILEKAVNSKAWSKITYKGYNYTPYLNEGGLGENDIIDARSISYTPIETTLKKAQGHVAASKWADLAIRDRDFVQDNFSIINADFPRIFDAEIAAGLTQFGTQAVVGGAFDVIAPGDFHSTYIPTKTFRAGSVTIRATGGVANTMVMNSKTFEALSLNTWMRGGAVVFGAIDPMNNAGTRTATNSLLPGYTIYISEGVPDATIYQYWKEGILFLRGPTRTSTVDDNLRYKVSQIVDQWYGLIVRNTSLGVKIPSTNS
jgi:hypothetical protein